jgi:uncharacterized protein YdbL (DUF1318 family)
MSETITLGKSRKDGKWIVLVQPERPFGEHLEAYRAISIKSPINEEYSRVIMGKIHHSSPALTLSTATQAQEKARLEAERQKSVLKIIQSADQRSEKIASDTDAQRQEEHEKAIEEKNLIINQVRKDSGQEVFKNNGTETVEVKKTLPPVKK